MRETTCMFTGHRELDDLSRARLRGRLEAEILSLIARGVTEFLGGGARGFDCEAALSVLRLRGSFPAIRLSLALPCENQEKFWTRAEKEVYYQIKDAADEVAVLQKNYDSGCMMRRNRYMADRSAFCISFLNKNFGGTFNTVMYALKSGVNVINIV